MLLKGDTDSLVFLPMPFSCCRAWVNNGSEFLYGCNFFFMPNHSAVLSNLVVKRPCYWTFNSFWPSDAILWHRSGSTLAMVKACCPTHKVNSWINIDNLKAMSQENFQPSVTKIGLKITYLNLNWSLPGSNELTISDPVLHNWITYSVPSHYLNICHLQKQGHIEWHSIANLLKFQWMYFMAFQCKSLEIPMNVFYVSLNKFSMTKFNVIPTIPTINTHQQRQTLIINLS